MRYGNGKLSQDILDKILSSKEITSKQIDLLLWLCLRSDSVGLINNVKYNEVMEDIHCSHQEYYDCIYKLKELGFIQIVNRHNFNGWTIMIFNNMYMSEEDDKKNKYLSINRSALYSEEFLNLKANEKKLLLKLLRENTGASKPFYLYAQTIEKWIGITNMQLIRSYIEKLKKFFNVTISETKKGLFILVIKSISTANTLKSIADYYLNHKIKGLLRSHRIEFNDTILSDLTTLYHQYEASQVSYALKTSIDRYKDVAPARVHKILLNTYKAK